MTQRESQEVFQKKFNGGDLLDRNHAMIVSQTKRRKEHGFLTAVLLVFYLPLYVIGKLVKRFR